MRGHVSGDVPSSPEVHGDEDVDMDEDEGAANDGEVTPRKKRTSKRPNVLSPGSEKDARPAQRQRRLSTVPISSAPVSAVATVTTLVSDVYIIYGVLVLTFIAGLLWSMSIPQVYEMRTPGWQQGPGLHVMRSKEGSVQPSGKMGPASH
jgi:hypothetical protein